MFNILIVILLGIYFLIKGKLSFVSRRRLLFSLPVLAWFSIELNGIIINSSEAIPNLVFELNVFNTESEVIATEKTFFTWDSLYRLGVIISFLILSFKLGRVFLFFRKLECEVKNGIKVYKSDLAGSFTFFNKIHLAISDVDNPIILEHESIHVKNRHTLELLIIEIWQLFFWFNPFIYLLKYELKQTQEFEVDEILFKKHHSKYIEILLNYTLSNPSNNYLLTSQFYTKLSLAKRTKNMKNSTMKNKKWLLVIPFAAIMLSVVSCAKTEEKVLLTTEQTQSESFVQAEYKGGTDAMFKYLGENIKYPEQAKANGVEGVVYVGFVISDKGELENIEVKRGVNEQLDAAAVQAVEEMPNWEPAIYEGETAKVEMVLPINFSLK